MFVNPPYLVKKILNENLIWEIPVSKKEIFVTFDDGPTTELTEWILDTLKKFNAKATFFCVGNNVKNHPELHQKILQDGHSIGNHTFDHLNGWKSTTKDYLRNVIQCSKYIESELFRPPYAKIKPMQIEGLKNKFSIVQWSVMSYDYDNTISMETCLDNVINHSKRGSIVVFHDNLKAKENLFYTLPRFLEYFSKKRFHFEPLTKEKCLQSLELTVKKNKLFKPKDWQNQ